MIAIITNVQQAMMESHPKSIIELTIRRAIGPEFSDENAIGKKSLNSIIKTVIEKAQTNVNSRFRESPP